MARAEQEKQERKQGKKRKHVQEPSEEVAPKSLILETNSKATDKPSKRQPSEPEKEISKKRSKKRAEQQVTTSQAPEVEASSKKLKRKQGSAEETPSKREKREAQESEEDDQEEAQPTAEQLREAARPENANAVVTVRQKKKQKHQQRMEAQRAQNCNKEAESNREYLLKWQNSRTEWKFNKMRQLSIQQTAFDLAKLDAELWPTALAYLASSQGAARDKISRLAEAEIERLDKECEQLAEEDERRKVIESTHYQRARDLLQSFD